MATPEDVLNIARSQLGYSWKADPEDGNKFGRFYGDPEGQYCIYFQSWCLNQAGVSAPGYPCARASVAYKHANRAIADAQPGDLAIVETNNNRADGPDHGNIVEENTGYSLKTIDGNVGGGYVARREYRYDKVWGIVHPDYDGNSSGTSTDTGTSDTGNGELLLDSDLGILTVSAWARQLGLSGSDADGYISYQYSGNKQYLQNFSSCIFNWYSGCPGSPTAKAIQRKVGSANVDGVLGKVDIENIQRWLNENFGYHMLVDGVCGPTTAYNIQHSINNGFWS